MDRDSGRATATSAAIAATVIARWDDTRALLRTDAGITFDVPISGDIARHVDVGASVCAVLSPNGDLDHWWLERMPEVIVEVEPRGELRRLVQRPRMRAD